MLTTIKPESEPPPASFSNKFRHLLFFWSKCLSVIKAANKVMKEFKKKIFACNPTVLLTQFKANIVSIQTYSKKEHREFLLPT